MRDFGDLEAAVMERLWACGRAVAVREVLDDLNRQRNLAYTTVMTVLDNLYRKGWLTRELDRRAYRYSPVSSRQEYSAELLRRVLDESGDNAQTLLRFVGEMTVDEADAVRRALRSRGRIRDEARR